MLLHLKLQTCFFLFFYYDSRVLNFCRENRECYLSDAYSAEEIEIQDPLPLSKLTKKDGKRPAVFLRFRWDEQKSILCIVNYMIIRRRTMLMSNIHNKTKNWTKAYIRVIGNEAKRGRRRQRRGAQISFLYLLNRQ